MVKFVFHDPQLAQIHSAASFPILALGSGQMGLSGHFTSHHECREVPDMPHTAGTLMLFMSRSRDFEFSAIFPILVRWPENIHIPALPTGL